MTMKEFIDEIDLILNKHIPHGLEAKVGISIDGDYTSPFNGFIVKNKSVDSTIIFSANRYMENYFTMPIDNALGKKDTSLGKFYEFVKATSNPNFDVKIEKIYPNGDGSYNIGYKDITSIAFSSIVSFNTIGREDPEYYIIIS